MTKYNPNIEYGSWLHGRRNPPRPKDEPAESYVEQDKHRWELEALYGKQEPLPKPKNSRIN